MTVARSSGWRQTGAVRKVPWSDGEWLSPPGSATEDGGELVVASRSGSDFWRTTSYGFVHDDGHALLVPFTAAGAVEVEFRATLHDLFDQAGLMLRIDGATWLKAGIELTEGAWHVGVVVTHGVSDWSLAPVPEWEGRRVTIRASRTGDAVTVRARADDDPWRMLRLAPFPVGVPASAGPMVCSPLGAGATVRFSRFELGPPDPEVHATEG
jgi:regulation of enolase protein 1 (concanavalin A-like superfamily)